MAGGPPRGPCGPTASRRQCAVRLAASPLLPLLVLQEGRVLPAPVSAHRRSLFPQLVGLQEDRSSHSPPRSHPSCVASRRSLILPHVPLCWSSKRTVSCPARRARRSFFPQLVGLQEHRSSHSPPRSHPSCVASRHSLILPHVPLCWSSKRTASCPARRARRPSSPQLVGLQEHRSPPSPPYPCPSRCHSRHLQHSVLTLSSLSPTCEFLPLRSIGSLSVAHIVLRL